MTRQESFQESLRKVVRAQHAAKACAGAAIESIDASVEIASELLDSIEALKVDFPTPTPGEPTHGARFGDVIVSPQEGAGINRILLGNQAPVFQRTFRHIAGEVEQVIIVLYHGTPHYGSVLIPNLRYEWEDGEEFDEESQWIDPRLLIDPGGCYVRVDYRGGSELEFFEELIAQTKAGSREFAAFMRQSPGSAFDQKLMGEYRRILDGQAFIAGPYSMAWPDDRGDAQGGQGIEPDWWRWRGSLGGIAAAFRNAIDVMHRTFRANVGSDGDFLVDPDNFSSSVAFNKAKGFEREDLVSVLEVAKRAGVRLPKWRDKYRALKTFDSQHLARLTRELMFLLRFFPDHSFLGWCAHQIGTYQLSCHLPGQADEGADGNFWSLERKLRVLYENPHQKTNWAGRGAVHECRFDRFYAEWWGAGPAIKVAGDYEKLFALAADQHGRAHVDLVSKLPEAKDYTTWDHNDKATQTRELQLALRMYEDSGNPELLALVEPLREWLGPFPASQYNYTLQTPFGRPNGYNELMTHGDLSRFGDSRGLLEAALARGADAGGAQPLNSCRSHELWAA